MQASLQTDIALVLACMLEEIKANLDWIELVGEHLD